MHLIDPAPYGGAEAVVSALARGAAGQGDEICVVAFRQAGDGKFLRRFDGDGIETVELRSPRRRYWREVRELAALIRAWHPDILHTHVYHADAVGYLAARSAGVPIVSTVHGFTAGSLKNRFYQWLDVQVLKRMDGIACVSQVLVDRLRAEGIAPARVHLVPNAHDGSVALNRSEARKILDVSQAAPLVGWIGRLSYEKGPDRFVRVLASLRPNIEGIIIGDGPERAALEKQVATQSAPITLVGAYPDAGRLVTAFDVLAITSRTEGLPMTVLHAMAAGVPVVATAVGALPEALGDSSGWLVDPNNESAFSSALSEAVQDRALARQRADQARLRLRRLYSLDAWIERMNRVYDQSRRPHSAA